MLAVISTTRATDVLIKRKTFIALHREKMYGHLVQIGLIPTTILTL